MKKILVVDDDQGILEMMKDVLELYGFSVFLLSDGAHIFQMLDYVHPDLLIMDVMMGAHNGIDIHNSIKEHKNYHSLPVLMMSAVYQPLKYMNSKTATNSFIAKPFDISQLIDRVRKSVA